MVAKRSQAGILADFAAGALALAVTTSAAFAPSARADDLSNLIIDLNDDVANGPTAFANAFTDFGTGHLESGVAQLLSGVDDCALGPENTLVLATVEVLAGDPINSSWSWGFILPSDFAEAEAVAQNYFTNAMADIGIAANDFSTGDYVLGTVNDLLAADYSTIMPVEELIVGAAASF